MSDSEVEHRIRVDNSMQMRWVQIMQPRTSMLKFRLPWDQGLYCLMLFLRCSSITSCQP
jgi:hypothetical protein